MRKQVEEIDFEELGFRTRLENIDLEKAKEICALRIHGYEQSLQPAISEKTAQIQESKNQDHALHVGLYDRPIPVNDAAMLVRSIGIAAVVVLAILVGIASFAGNVALFLLFGFGLLVALLLAVGATALPLAIGHLAYERIIAPSKALQAALVLGLAALCIAAVVQFGRARSIAVDKASAQETRPSYVDDGVSDATVAQETPNTAPESESNARQTLGGATFTMLVAADLALGFLVGLIAKLRHDEDYASWRELKKIRKKLRTLEKELSEMVSSIEIAKVQCMAGILRAEGVLRKRRPPYHKALAAMVVGICIVSGARQLWAQTIERYEGILIDTSGSIARGGTTTDLFREYLFSTKKLLLTEPPNGRVWVILITTDSFGGVQDVLKGWTPEPHGIFTDDLTRARRQLASSFEAKSSGMSPVAAGTDIIGGLWRMKALFESNPKADTSVSKTIWIFSDMVNETRSFPMPALIGTGPEQMLERVKANGLLVPLKGYRIYIQGASPNALSPQAWATDKKFWEMYFAAAGADLISYSTECAVQR